MTFNRLIIGILLAAFTGGVFLASPVFQVEEIELRGYDEQAFEIAEYPGDNIFNLENIDELIEVIKEEPYIDSVDIQRRLPDTIILDISYKRPEAALFINGGYTVFNRYFEIIDIGLEENKHRVPVLENIPYRFEGREIVIPDEAAKIVEHFEYLDEDLLRSMDRVDFQNDMIVIEIEGGGDILLGRAEEVERKFFVLNSLWREQEHVFFNMEYVDLTAPDRPVLKE